MNHSVTMYDPTGEQTALQRQRLSPPDSLENKVVALFDIGKIRSDEFLDYVESELGKRKIKSKRFAKPTNTRVSPAEILQAIADEADVVIEALAD